MPKRRENCFFGLHFDFHSRGALPVGQVMQPEIIARLLDETKPDYVQVDTKGHPGHSSYPTRVGNPAPLIAADPLKMWREATRARDIALFGHHSGLYDQKVCAQHPEWAVVDERGVVSDSYLSVFSDYADAFLIPQLLELALDWELDGAWVDGECWGTKLDYSENALRAWRKEHDTPPPKPGEAGFHDYLEFIRKGFTAYVTHYLEVLREKAPNFQITSNWIWSAYMPEEPTVNVAFLSGDYMPNNSLNSARANGRFISCQGFPWDLMAWGHNSEAMWTTDDRSTKEYIQHAQEAAYVMALGGGFQFYNIQYGEGGTVQEWAIPIWKKTAEFVRAREPYCKGVQPVPQVGILLPSEAHKALIDTPYQNESPALNAAIGLIHLAQDCGYSSEILETHHIEKFKDYPVIVLAHSTDMEQKTIDALREYAANGGQLLVASPDAAGLLGFAVTQPEERLIHLCDGQRVAPLFIRSADFKGADEVVGEYYLDNYMRDGAYAAAVKRGNVVALGFDLGNAYPANRTPCIRSFFKSQMARLFPQPLVTVEGSSYAELTITQRDGKLFVHLLNYAGDHNTIGVRSYDEIPALRDLTVRIHTEKEPACVTIQPAHRVWEGDKRVIRIDKLEVHTILEIEF